MQNTWIWRSEKQGMGPLFFAAKAEKRAILIWCALFFVVIWRKLWESEQNPKTIMQKMWPVQPEKVWKSERNTYPDIYYCIADTLRLYRLASEEPEKRQRCQQQGNNAPAPGPVDRVSRKVYGAWQHSFVRLPKLLRDVWGISCAGRKWNGNQNEAGDRRTAHQKKRVIYEWNAELMYSRRWGTISLSFGFFCIGKHFTSRNNINVPWSDMKPTGAYMEGDNNEMV